ncbi:HEPN domain-containing protein [Candidatus Pacearchaeota archaeon]|nr:HEPN domain-containing protein [Candidatus Pacearchaeota archaeon]
MDFQKCLDEGFIRKDRNVEERVSDEILLAERFLNSAKNNLKIKEYEMCVIAAYNSIFHCERALLYKKGYTERSHFCIVVALKRFYDDEKLIELLHSADKIRISRHEVQYRGKFVERGEVEFVIGLAEQLLNHTKEIL